MAEHIVAVFDSEGAAEAAVRDLEQAGISTSAIRRYRPSAMSAGNENSGGISPTTGHSGTGGFWSWLLGEEPGAETTRSLSLDEQAYEQHAQAGKAVISVLVEDDAKIHQAVTLVTAHHPIEMEEQTEELKAQSSPETGSGYSPHAGLAGSTAETGVAAEAKPSSAAEEVIPLAEENLEIGKRTVDRGTTRVRRYVVERPVERDVALRGQRVTIERRRPIETSVPGHAFEERTVEVRETEEVPVVEKTARVVEEVAIRKEETERTEKVRDTVRREEVEVTDNNGRQTSP
jgi:uncharacterized protein (TIGR02271 family)